LLSSLVASDPRAPHAGTGVARNRAISIKISWNICRETGRALLRVPLSRFCDFPRLWPRLTEGRPSHPIGERWRSAIGSARSLVIYYGNPMRRRRMDRLYSDFVRQGDLVFDIGSHVGDRIGSFRRLGCRVVAVEPQPRLVRILRRFYGREIWTS
jgi:hypothetical protein